MQIVYFTIVGIVLYFVSDWVVNRIEIYRGARLEHRTLLFFFILLTLAVVAFGGIERIMAA